MTTAPPYHGPTKTLSTNYTVEGTQFAIADEDGDVLEPEDIWRQGRAVEEHTHDDQRGLPVRRIDAVSLPSDTGHITVDGDDFKWWGDLSGSVLTAVTNGTDQTIDGVKRFADPLLLPRQVAAPPAPGPGLGYLYLGPSDRLYLRSGNNPPAPVGTPGMLVPALAWQTTQATGQPSVAQITLGADPAWALVSAVLIFMPHLVIDDGRVVRLYMAHVKRANGFEAGLAASVDQSFHVLSLWAVAMLLGAA